MDEPLKKDSIRYIDQMPQLQDLSPDDVIIVQDVSETTPGSNPYRKETLQHVVDRMNPLQSVNLTQAEYDALPEAEKLNGTYYNVTDDSPPPYQLYLDATMPVGFVYEQLPPTLDEDGTERTPLDPNALFNNGYVHSVWKKLDYDGAFFRADGGSALPFGTGVHGEELPNVKGNLYKDSRMKMQTGNYGSGGAFVTVDTGINGYIVNNTQSYAQSYFAFSASTGQTNADGTYLSAEESSYKDGGHVTPRNYTVIKWIRVA